MDNINKPHIEKEYKMMIDEEIYNNLLIDLDLRPFKQVNYYYSCFSKEYAARIRFVDEKYIFTLKVKGDGYKYEYEVEIPDNSINHKEVKDILNKFNIEKIEYLGSMTTYRATKDYKYGQLCVDKSEYINTVDYEIEFELFDYQNDSKDELDKLLNDYHITYTPSKHSKFKRFLDRL